MSRRNRPPGIDLVKSEPEPEEPTELNPPPLTELVMAFCRDATDESALVFLQERDQRTRFGRVCDMRAVRGWDEALQWAREFSRLGGRLILLGRAQWDPHYLARMLEEIREQGPTRHHAGLVPPYTGARKLLQLGLGAHVAEPGAIPSLFVTEGRNDPQMAAHLAGLALRCELEPLEEKAAEPPESATVRAGRKAREEAQRLAARREQAKLEAARAAERQALFQLVCMVAKVSSSIAAPLNTEDPELDTFAFLVPPRAEERPGKPGQVTLSKHCALVRTSALNQPLWSCTFQVDSHEAHPTPLDAVRLLGRNQEHNDAGPR